MLIGSNDGDTLQSDVAHLVSLIGLPRAHARLEIVNYAGASYQSEAYHLKRDDGSQAAYVGSANLSLAGIGCLHVEAGLIIDSRDGDPVQVLDAIAQGVDDWFAQSRVGMETVITSADIPQLVLAEILALSARATRAAIQTGGSIAGPVRPRLQALVRFQPVIQTARNDTGDRRRHRCCGKCCGYLARSSTKSSLSYLRALRTSSERSNIGRCRSFGRFASERICRDNLSTKQG